MFARRGTHLGAASVREAWARFVAALEPPYALNQVLLALLDRLADLVPADAYHAYVALAEGDVPRLRITRQQSTVPNVGPAYAGLVASTPVQQVPLELPLQRLAPGQVLVREQGNRVEIHAAPNLAIVLVRPPRRPLTPEERSLAEEWLRLTAPLVAIASLRTGGAASGEEEAVGRRAVELLTQSERVLSFLCRLGREAVGAERGLLALFAAEPPRLLWQEDPGDVLAASLSALVRLAPKGGQPFRLVSAEDLPPPLVHQGVAALVLLPLRPQGLLVYGAASALAPPPHLKTVLTTLASDLELTLGHCRTATAAAEGYLRVLLAAVDLLDAADPNHLGHHRQVAALAARLAQALGRPRAEQEALHLAGRLHDLGMVAVSLGLPLKPGTLSDQERQLVRAHPALGAELLAGLPASVVPPSVVRAVRQHHEAWDGSGYPDGLSGEEIAPEGRILAVAEQFVARITPRSYRPATPLPQALYLMGQIRGKTLAPDVVDALLALYAAAGVQPLAPGVA